jgi:hypothetical protein
MSFLGSFLSNKACPPDNQYLFTPHNEIFHVIAMVGFYVFFKGFKEDIKHL